MTILFGFIAGLLTDMFWSFYVSKISEGKAFASANWSIAIHLCSLVATVLLIDKAYMAIIAYLIGGYIGTYFAVRFGSVSNDMSAADSVSLQQETH